SVAMNGEIWVWNAPQIPGGNWSGRIIRGQDPSLNSQVPAIFVDNNHIVAAQRSQPEIDSRWKLVIYRADGQLVTTAPLEFRERVNQLARSPDGAQFAATTSDGQVFLFGNNFAGLRELRGRGDYEAQSVAFGPGGLLAVSYNQRSDDDDAVEVSKGKAFLELWNIATVQLLDVASIAQEENVLAINFSNDGQWLATHSDDNQEILVYQLRQPNGPLIPKPLTTRFPLRLRGRGKEIDRVAFHRPGPNQPIQIGFGTDGDPSIHNVFTPSTGLVERFEQALPEQEWINGDSFAAGYSVRSVNQQSLEYQDLQVFAPNGLPVGTIRLNILKEGGYTGAYCFLPGPNGQPRAVAIGTDNHAAIFVYGLQGKGGALPVWRYFRDHSGEVQTLSVSGDGRFLVSGSKDQTIKIWSLEGLGKPSLSRDFSRWGADFVLRGNQIVVENVLKSGIAFGRNLRNGDVLAGVVFPGANKQFVRDPRQILAGFASMNHYDQIFPDVVRQGQPIESRVVNPGWEPLITLFVDVNNEWAMFTPEGYYDASAADGHRLFGWHFNLGTAQTPRFEPAGNVQKDFERPDVIRKVLEQGSVADALASLNQPVPNRLDTLIPAAVSQVPTIKIEQPLQTDSFQAGQQITVAARVSFPDPNMAEQYLVQADYSGRNLGDPTSIQRNGNDRIYRWRTTCDQSLTELAVSARETGKGTLASNHQMDKISIRGEEPRPVETSEDLPQLHLLAIGAEKYDSNVDLPELYYAVDDVEAISELFTTAETQQRIYETIQEPIILRNEEVTKEELIRAIQLVKSRVMRRKNPRDLVLCYFCAHGTEQDKEFYLHPTNMKDLKPETVKKLSIPWTGICDQLNQLPCHVIWMIDACHSGAAVKSEDNKAVIRDSANPNRFVLAAASASQASREFDIYEHGAFTEAVLRGLKGRADAEVADKPNGKISVHELATFVRREVSTLTNAQQNPCHVPIQRPPSNQQSVELDLLGAAPVAPGGGP
ncbi:MAG: caspase family protein, partial [Planctomycetaceae bacterium]|nr:caspase family protein [Planctomycetaceae bacterium]